MTDTEILEKAVQKAKDGGWSFNDWTDADDFEWHIGYTDYDELSLVIHGMDDDYYWSPSLFIFSHDFAKALWGEEKVYQYVNIHDITVIEAPRYHIHLQNMVIADDPIKYIGENI